MVEWNGGIANSANLMHEDNNSDLMASLAYSFTEIKVSKLDIHVAIVASL